MLNHSSRRNICCKSHGSNQTVHVLYAIPSAQPAEYPKMLSFSLSHFSGVRCAALPFVLAVSISPVLSNRLGL